MSPPSNFDIRFSVEEDLKFLQQWFADPKACDDFPFGIEEKEEALKNWIGFAKYKACLTGLIDQTPCTIGSLFLMPYKKVAHHCSFYLMVDPQQRRAGIGTSMVRNLQHLAKTRFRLENIHVELFDKGHLLPLLLKEGFKQFVRQENFAKIDGLSRARILLEKNL